MEEVVRELDVAADKGWLYEYEKQEAGARVTRLLRTQSTCP